MFLCDVFRALIDDLRKSRGLHSVSAFGHGPVHIARFCWGYSEHVRKMTDTRKQKAEKASGIPIKHSLFVGNMQIG